MSGLTIGAPLALAEGGTFWFTKGNGPIADSSDLSFYVIFWICFFFFWAITIALAVIMVRYRRRPDYRPKPSPTHNNALEITWTIIPLFLVIPIFWAGFTGYLNLFTPPANSYQINVTGQKWNWSFEYPTGHIDGQLHFPVGRPVELTMGSNDVLHSLFIPDFRVKQDVVPGRYTKIWFEADEAGTHHLFCTEYCGTSHSEMITQAVGHSQEEFDAWMEKALDPSDKTLAAYGEELYAKVHGCATCHTTDGSASTGPTFQNLFGYERRFTDGTSAMGDENYIRQSILEPMAHIREGFQGVMPTFQGKVKEDQLRALIAFIKLQSDKLDPDQRAELEVTTVGEARNGDSAAAPAGDQNSGVEVENTSAGEAGEDAEGTAAEEQT